MKDLMKKTREDLNKLLAEKREALRQFRFNVAGSKVRDMRDGRDARKEIARILTVLNHPSYEN
jgi:ribosomal protein L29